VELTVGSTTGRQVIDLTSGVEGLLDPLLNGLVVVSVPHSTAAITTANLDPGTEQDLLDALFELIPKREWRHAHNPSHTPDHLLASIVGSSLAVLVKKGKLSLGVWQHLVLIEFDGPRSLTLDVVFLEI